jgi:uncharacterized protein YneF (UPF0154 family)
MHSLLLIGAGLLVGLAGGWYLKGRFGVQVGKIETDVKA